MPRFLSLLLTVCLSLSVFAQAPAETKKAVGQTVLDKYVHAPDPSYRYEVVKTVKGEGHTIYIVDMISQTWRTSDEVDRTQWQHYLTIVKPDKVTSDIGFMFIGGGSNNGRPPNGTDPFLVQTAMNSGTVVTEIGQTPNQPLVFKDGRRRGEDSLIAYTWIQAMETGDDTWLARNPMTKGVVRAMDTVTSVMKEQADDPVDVKRFVVAGGSKRGWTTWTTAAVDKRVIAIAPIVIDVLNVDASMRHHFKAYGYWARAIGDYLRGGTMKWMDTPEYARILSVVDPYAYRDRLTLPKYIINSTGDQFFLPDSSQFYFDGLKGEKMLRYVANSDHGLGGSDARESLFAFYYSVVNDIERPKLSWEVRENDLLVVTPSAKPTKVELWRATNETARNFRKDSIGNAYRSLPLSPASDGTYRARLTKPEKGFTAYFIEMTFDSGGPMPFKFTTPVFVRPDELPFKDKPFDKE